MEKKDDRPQAEDPAPAEQDLASLNALKRNAQLKEVELAAEQTVEAASPPPRSKLGKGFKQFETVTAHSIVEAVALDAGRFLTLFRKQPFLLNRVLKQLVALQNPRRLRHAEMVPCMLFVSLTFRVMCRKVVDRNSQRRSRTWARMGNQSYLSGCKDR